MIDAMDLEHGKYIRQMWPNFFYDNEMELYHCN